MTGRDTLTRLGDTLNPGRQGSNAFDIFGQMFGRSTSTADQLSAARTRVSRLEYDRDGGIGWSPREFEDATAEVCRLESAMGGAAEKGKEARNNLTSLTLQPLLDSLNPSQRRLEALTAQAESFRRFLTTGGVNQDGASRRAIEGLLSQARQLKEDIAAGGAPYADALRAAKVESSLVGATAFGRNAAGINADADNKRVQAFRNAGTDTTSDALDKQLRAIEETRRLELETSRRTQALEQAQVGGVFSRLSQEVQQQFLTAAQNPRYARIPVEIAAAITGPESGGNLDIGYSRSLGEDGRRSSAYGLGQITAGTAADAIRRGYLPPSYDRTNRETMAEGILSVLSMTRDDNGGEGRTRGRAMVSA